jgi:phenylalanyl-tRNA synthetase alpha chain
MPHTSTTIRDIRSYVQEQLEAKTDPAEIRLQVLGKKGSLTQVLRGLADLTKEEKATLGAEANTLRIEIEDALANASVAQEDPIGIIDITVPPFQTSLGTIHPVSAMTERMVDIFAELSFEVVEGSEIVSDTENFENLNIHRDHPARDSHESFFLDGERLLRTHTTSVDVLEMNRRFKKGQLPIRIVVPGKVYRQEATDSTHAYMFHQFDAVMVDTQTTFSDLKGCLDYFAKRLFGTMVETRFRPHHFPFTEPSAELDIRWKGASTGSGKHTEWLEMGGCGMIHPDVLKRAGINPKIYQGWAFGMSIERPIMIENQLPDIRMLYGNAVPFLSQFTTKL